jgi:DNA-binding CsgD family transcriptional regulator
VPKPLTASRPSIERAIVLFGDVVGSRRDPEGSSGWLRTLCGALEIAYPPVDRVASFGFTQGDELQGLLAPSADPFRAVLLGALHKDARPMRWSIALGPVAPGSGPATERAGEAFLRAREGLVAAKLHRDGLVVTTGEPGADHLLTDLAPLLSELLSELTPSQARIARLMLIEDQRQADVADALGVSRATVSVAHARGHIRSIDRLLDALRGIMGAARMALDETSPVADAARLAAEATEGTR